MFLTCIFKVHNPSQHKRRVLDHALEEYSYGYQSLLDWAAENIDVLREHGQYTDKDGNVRGYTGKSIARMLPRVEAAVHSSLRDSLKVDVAGNLASFFELEELELSKEEDKRHMPSFPAARNPHPDTYPFALEDFVEAGENPDLSLEEFNFFRDRFLKVSRGQYMPLYFAGADGASRARNFSLLAHYDKRMLLAALWLLPNKHHLRKPMNARNGDLFRIDTGNVLTYNGKSAILVPLEVGKNGWQEEKFLNPALTDEVAIKAAVLSKKEDDYFLHVMFDFPTPKAYKPETYLGIDKGIVVTAAWALVDREGCLLELGHFEDKLRYLQHKYGKERERLARNGRKITRKHYKQGAYDSILHTLANDLIDLALQNRAMIVVEDLNVEVKGSRVTSRFRKFDKILAYKCKLAGVPFKHVFPQYSSRICHCCGEDLYRDKTYVQCEFCGYEGHSDENAAVNIARRALYRKKEWENHREFHRSFTT